MATFNWGDLILPAFSPDSRGKRIEKYTVAQWTDKVTPERWLYICGPVEAVEQIEYEAGPWCERVEVEREWSKEYNYCLYFAGGLTQGVVELAELLSHSISIPKVAGLDRVIALDMYKDPDSHTDSNQWENTHTASLMSKGKYWRYDTGERRRMRRAVTRMMANYCAEHPQYRLATAIVTPPGSLGGTGYAAELAKAVAAELGIPFHQAESVAGPLSPRKNAEGDGALPVDAFDLNADVSGRVLILDDVFRTGGTLIATADAARRAGADEVYGLTVVRTMRGH